MLNPPLAQFHEPAPQDGGLSAAILLVPGFSNLTLASIMEPLRAANHLSGRPLYQLHLVSETGRPAVSSSGLSLPVEGSLAGLSSPAMLFIVSAFEPEAFCRPEPLRQLRRMAAAGSLLAGLESGAYLLARAGLLKGYRATFHWEDFETLRERFPDIALVEDRYVVDRGRATTGGAIPTLDFAINLLRHQQGFSLALEVASTFIYEQESSPREAQRSVSLGRMKWAEPQIAAAVELMERHLEKPLALGEIARRIGVSERSLHRGFVRLLESPPSRFYQWVRLKAARRLLLQTDLPVSEVALACGFQDRTAFSRAFKARFGDRPGALRRP